MTAAPRSTRQRSIVVIGAFLYLWVMVVVALATLTLLGPVTWMTGRSGWRSWPYGAGAFALLVLLLASFVLARWLLRRTLLSASPFVRAAIPAVITLVALAGAWAWLVSAEAAIGPDVSEFHRAGVQRLAGVGLVKPRVEVPRVEVPRVEVPRVGVPRVGVPRVGVLHLGADERVLSDERVLADMRPALEGAE